MQRRVTRTRIVLSNPSASLGKKYVPISKAIDAFWGKGHLLETERAVLRFIVARTLRYNKLEERISLRHFEKGIVSKGGEVVISGLSCSKRTIIRGIEALVRKGLIAVQRFRSVERGHEQNSYSINVEVVEAGRALVTNETKGSDNGNQGLCQLAPTKVQKEKVLKLRSGLRTPGVPPGVAPLRIKRERPAVKKRILRQRPVFAERATYPEIASAWEWAMRQTYPTGVPIVFSRKDIAVFQSSAHCLKGVSLRAFFEWVVSNWGAMQTGRLSWMTKSRMPIPSAPQFAVLARHLLTFAIAYAEERVQEKRSQPIPISVRESVLVEELRKAQRALNVVKAEREVEPRELRATQPRGPTTLKPNRRRTEDVPMTSDLLQTARTLYNENPGLGKWDDR